jgi:hypothetical protein
MTDENQELLQSIRRLHARIRDRIVAECERSGVESMATVVRDESGDTIYAIDHVSETITVDFMEREIAPSVPIILIAEGLPTSHVVLPRGCSEEEAVWRIIVDPIDGTRGLMYQKRSAWILTGVAPNRGDATSLQDILLAVQTEIPLVKQHLSDCVWTSPGQEVQAERYNRLTGESRTLQLRPSGASTIDHGFATFCRFFPGAREEIAAIDEEIVLNALGPVRQGKAHCFEDQYICTGGQLYELMSGHDRFVADLRPQMESLMSERGLALGICCHPYDVCTELIARKLGVIITDANGRALNSRLNVSDDVDWVGYANERIQAGLEPHLQSALKRRGLLAR